MAAERRKSPKGHRPRPGAELGETDGEPTLVGLESWRDLPSRRLLRMREQQRHRVQHRAVLGLTLLLAVVLLLGVLAMAGVGLGWFEQSFALQVLALTITPSFTGWLLVVRWAFGPDRRSR